ncbi:MAG TPA: DUF2892 domain-containing protein [Leptospiraceae bacterium]|nr:DUF2892 domain-containing protein [Leptospiraceae bacterium]HMY65597.1 DUF2892 domain-containing protein [Leptospiraceae bacterium]HMZ57916.1 DUF2892 domain-containing protein [Leptospiraceae bacterium]HNF12754.1 DUF2892 domain-containing protein [Leptospiraceae bacterium]HNF23525.1 DUF2892 domain-containing protein [Leptospiraceae bacterium]
MYISEKKYWYLERVTYLLGGIFNLIGILLTVFVHPYWIILPVLVGLNLVVYSVTGFCIMANLLYYIGVKPLCEIKKAADNSLQA